MKLLSILFLFSVITHAQTGTIKFIIEQENGYYEILINDTLLLKTYKDTFSKGH
ncbi:hypothetical protein [Putridiphycobacter roseus]|uniref:hypothetical protein n=1 Tax=Putridiphycobacter roseus TaxID=2219161 RepID=UPI001314E8E7|nr:hypothetical protein [Putridiphycobacter roseus]